MMLALVALTLIDSGKVVLVDSNLGTGCVRSTSAYTVVVADPASGSDLEKQRKWIAEARAAWAQGRELELELASERAQFKLEEALALFGRGAPALDDFSEYARTLIDLGAVFAEAHKDELAAQAFRRAIVLDIIAQPDGKEYPPEVIKHFRKVAAELARQPRSSVAVTGKPEGATVFWDGHAVGEIPVSISDALPGDHWLTALAPGHKRFSTLVTLSRRAEHVEVFMRELDSSTPREQLALASVTHGGQPTERELAALREVSRGGRLIALSRDPRGTLRCAAQYRSFDAQGGASAVMRVDSATPIDLAALPATPASIPPVALEIPAADRTTNAFVALLPLGIGQFVEHRPGPGVALLGTQLALVATNIACYAIAQSNRVANGTYDNASRVQALQIATDVAASMLIVDIIAGAIDGLVHR